MRVSTPVAIALSKVFLTLVTNVRMFFFRIYVFVLEAERERARERKRVHKWEGPEEGARISTDSTPRAEPNGGSISGKCPKVLFKDPQTGAEHVAHD